VTDNYLRVARYVTAVILVLYSLHSGFVLLRESRHEYRHVPDPDSVQAFETRFAPLRVYLSQAGCEKAGYVTDIPENDSEWFSNFRRTQYVFAPIIVDYSLKPSLIVANLRDPSSISSILRDKHLSLVSDYGNGVVLLASQTR
jgi:hypothetical protein